MFERMTKFEMVITAVIFLAVISLFWGWVPVNKRSADYHTALSHTTLAAGATTTYGDEFRLPRDIYALALVLDSTTQGTDNADKLDVYIQTKVDGTNWVDVYHFTQIDGDAGTAKRFVGKMEIWDTLTEFDDKSAGLGVHTGRDIFGDKWRVKTIVTDGDGDSTWSYSVSVCPM